jgi:hypothetical protein
MSSGVNPPPVDKWGLLFGDPKDQTLSDTTRNECLALFTQNEITSRGLISGENESPRKKTFMERAGMIDQLAHATEERKVAVQSMLCMDYLTSKNSPYDVASMQQSQNNNYECNSMAPLHNNKKRGLDFSSAHSLTLDDTANTKSNNKSQVRQVQSDAIHTECLTKSVLDTKAIWTETLISDTIEFSTRWEAIQYLGPLIVATKTLRIRDLYVNEYKCADKSCSARMRLQSLEEGWFVPATLEFLHCHNHQPCDWITHYRLILDPNKTSKKPNAGLPPLVKALTDQFSLEPSLGPTDIFRKIFTIFRMDPLWSSAATRKYLKIQVNQRTRSVRNKSPNQMRIVYTKDLIEFKHTHQLRLPPDFLPQPISTEIHLTELARSLEKRGYLCGRKSEVGVPHQDLIVLQYSDSIQENTRYQELLSKREKQFVLANTVVFSSLALLWNLCGANDLDWQVCGSADGTFNCCSNDYKLLGIGLFSINTDGTKRFHPLVYALAQGEIELVALIAMHHLREASIHIFGLTPRFKGGLISDHTEVFTNAFHTIFPEDMLLQCFPHIIRKFRIDGAREGNGAYYRYLSGKNPPSWLYRVAENDVYHLRECRTDAMFRTMANMVLAAWRSAGEDELCNTFKDSYLMKDQFNKWYYCASGIPGCIPQNNSHERSNLDTKGCANFRGIINQGRNMTKMLNVEFPKLIYVNSSERVSTVRHYPILNKEKTLTKSLFDYYNQVDLVSDIVKFGDGFLVNKEIALGSAINVDLYQKSLLGEFEGTFDQRHLFVERVDDLCFVRKLKLSKKHPEFYCGSCFDFYNHLSCHHAAIFQYKTCLPTLSHKIPQSRGSVMRRLKKGRDRLQRAKEKRLTRSQASSIEAKSVTLEEAVMLKALEGRMEDKPGEMSNDTNGVTPLNKAIPNSPGTQALPNNAVPISQTQE